MTKLQTKGLLIVFEGTDGTGKSTQMQLLDKYLQDKGYPVVATREPTDGRYGREIRSLYMNRGDYSPERELELFLQDRREHVKNVLLPAIQEGKIVLCDRYFLSTAAYQGARGFDPENIMALNRFAPDPDLALLFQAPIETGFKRITCGRGDQLNDFEQKEGLARVAALFANIKRPYIQLIDASGSIEEVHHMVLKHVRNIIPLPVDQV